MKRLQLSSLSAVLFLLLAGGGPLSAQSPAPYSGPGTLEEASETKKKKKKYPDVDVGGEIEIEYVDVQAERHSGADVTEHPEGRVQIDFAAITVKASLARGVFGRFEARFRPAEPVDVQEAIFRVQGLPLEGFTQVGWDSRIVKPRRKTESYPLAGTAFWKGKELGLQVGIEWEFFEHRREAEVELEGVAEKKPGKEISLALVVEGSVGNGMALGKRPIGEDPSFRMLGFEEVNLDWNQSKEAGLSLGLKGRLFSKLRFDLSAFAYASMLSEQDRQILWDLPGYGSWESRDHWFFGYSARFRYEGATLFAHFCKGRLGRLGRGAWYVQGSYEFEWKGFDFLETRFFRSVEPVFRYGALDLDMIHDPADPLTWNRDRITLALLIGIVKTASLKLEYNLNGETTGGDEVRNDEFVALVEVRF
jgi:hypothetical protein